MELNQRLPLQRDSGRDVPVEGSWRAGRDRTSPRRDAEPPLRAAPGQVAKKNKTKKKKKKKKTAPLADVAQSGAAQLGDPVDGPPRATGGHVRGLPSTLEYLGHGIDGGFYYVDIGGIKLATPAHRAVITVLPDQDLAASVVISAETIRSELAGLQSGWTWAVRELSATEYSVVFPSAELLAHVSWSDTITLPLHKIRVSIRPSDTDPDMPPPLASVWVRIHGIPSDLRKEVAYVALISQAVGRFVAVDESSLPGDGPVRLQVLAPDPDKLNITLPTFYFDGVGRTLVVEVEPEGDRPRSTSPPSRRSRSPHHTPSDQEEGDTSEDDLSDGDDPRGEASLPSPAPTAPISAGP